MPYLQQVFTLVLIVFPALFLMLPRGQSAAYYLLLLCALVGIGLRARPAGKTYPQLLRQAWPLSLAMALLLLATLINQVATGRFSDSAFETPAQLACFSLLFWVLLLASEQTLKNLQWGLVLGVFSSTLAFYIQTKAGTQRPLFMFDVPIIPFGHITMLMGVMALLSLGWNDGHGRLASIAKVVAGAGALYCSYLSQTRGGWVALPMFVIIGFAVFKTLALRLRLALLMLVIVLIGGAYLASGTVQKRVALAQADIEHFFDGKDKNTSVGQRLQLWQGSLIVFMERPLTGIGRDRFGEAMQSLAKRQIITPQAAAQPHSHNDLLFQMATLGLPGLIAILALYFVPASYFLQSLQSDDQETRAIAGMGLTLTLGFFVFGLTDVMFFWRVSYTFYAIFLAVLFACLFKRRVQLGL